MTDISSMKSAGLLVGPAHPVPDAGRQESRMATTIQKRTYDKAAEAFCDHVQECPHCTMMGPHCEVGNDLLRAENEAWDAYRAAQQR